MPRRFVSALVVGSVLIAALAVVSPAPVAGHGSARPSSAHVAMPGWAAGLTSKMFAPLTQPRRARHAPTVIVPPPELGGTACYAVGGAVCSVPACARYVAAQQSAVYQPYGAALLGARSCTRPAKPLVPRVVPIRMP